MNYRHISILGAGSFGTALALLFARSGISVQMWTRQAADANRINQTRENMRYFPGFTLPHHISVTDNLGDVFQNSTLIFYALPVASLDAVLLQIKPFISAKHVLMMTCKGMDAQSGKLIDEIVIDALPNVQCGAFGGPNLARDMAINGALGITIAAHSEQICRSLHRVLDEGGVWVQSTYDVRGVMIGGALKNVAAILCGFLREKNISESALAAVLTRLYQEMIMFGVACQAQAETFSLFSGLGDLMLSAYSTASRNMSFGRKLAHGHQSYALSDATTEGVGTCRGLLVRSRQMSLILPLFSLVENLIQGKKSPEEVFQSIQFGK